MIQTNGLSQPLLKSALPNISLFSTKNLDKASLTFVPLKADADIFSETSGIKVNQTAYSLLKKRWMASDPFWQSKKKEAPSGLDQTGMILSVNRIMDPPLSNDQKNPMHCISLAKELFSNCRSSLKRTVFSDLGRANLFEVVDERGNGILHYLASATDPAGVTAFFGALVEQDKEGLKRAIIRQNNERKTPLTLLIGNVGLERYKRGHQRTFDKVSALIQSRLIGHLVNQRVLMRQTVFDQIFEFFEKYGDFEAIAHETLYDIFNEAWKSNGEEPFERSHWSKVRDWVERHFLEKINAIDPITGETLFQKAINRQEIHLIRYFGWKKNLDLNKIHFAALYDIFAFDSKDQNKCLIPASLRQALLARLEEVDPINGETLLHQAVRSGNADLVRYLKNRGIKDERPNFIGKTPEALAKERLDVLYPIFNKAAQFQNSDSRFEQWVRKSFFLIIDDLLDPENGNTLLHQAIQGGNIELLVYLKNHGARDGIKNFDGKTPEALINENIDLLYLVFDKSRYLQGSQFDVWVKKHFLIGMNESVHPTTKETLLHLAVRKKNFPLLAYFKALGAIGRPNAEGKTPEDLINDFNTLYRIFNIASQLEGMESAFQRWVKDHFLDRIDAVDPYTRHTFLYRAMCDKNVKLMAYLKNHGAKSQLRNLYRTASEGALKDRVSYETLYQMLDQASQTPGSEFEKWVKQFFLSHVNTTLCLETGNTLLHKAVELKNVKLIAYLKNYGAKDRVRNFSNKAPEDLVGFDLLYKIFDEARCAPESSFELWARGRFLFRIDTCLDFFGDTLLHKAVRDGNLGLLVYLKNHGARDEVSHFGRRTPESLTWGHVDMLYEVFDQARKMEGSGLGFERWVRKHFFSKIDRVDRRNGDTLLHKAAKARNIELFNYLKNLGARGSARNLSGKTAQSLEALIQSQDIQTQSA